MICFLVCLQLLIIKPKQRRQFGFNWLTEYLSPQKGHGMALKVWPFFMAAVSAFSQLTDMNSAH